MSDLKSLGGAWLQSMRPHTLTAGLSPVLVGSALAYHAGAFLWVPALLCLGVAVLAQIASNFANDYYDYAKGADGDGRLGINRGVMRGLISPKAMLRAALLTLALACLCGLGLLFYGEWWLLLVGVAIALAVLAYSAGPFPLSYKGLGDVSVLVFYGIIPVCFTYYVQVGSFSRLAFECSVALGLVAVNILLVNNYRDYAEDKASGKRTTIVRFGRAVAPWAYLLDGLVAFALSILSFWSMDLPKVVWGLWAAMTVLFVFLWKKMCDTDGAALNKVLGQTALFVFLFALLQTLSLLL